MFRFLFYFLLLTVVRVASVALSRFVGVTVCFALEWVGGGIARVGLLRILVVVLRLRWFVWCGCLLGILLIAVRRNVSSNSMIGMLWVLRVLLLLRLWVRFLCLHMLRVWVLCVFRLWLWRVCLRGLMLVGRWFDSFVGIVRSLLASFFDGW